MPLEAFADSLPDPEPNPNPPKDMEAKSIAERGPLKHFTWRDMFYLTGAIATVVSTAVINYTMFQHRVDMTERDLSKLVRHVEAMDSKIALNNEAIHKRITDIDHTGTIASKNGIFAETAITKENARRIDQMQSKWEEAIIKIERIDANVQGLLRKAEAK